MIMNMGDQVATQQKPIIAKASSNSAVKAKRKTGVGGSSKPHSSSNTVPSNVDSKLYPNKSGLIQVIENPSPKPPSSVFGIGGEMGLEGYVSHGTTTLQTGRPDLFLSYPESTNIADTSGTHHVLTYPESANNAAVPSETHPAVHSSSGDMSVSVLQLKSQPQPSLSNALANLSLSASKAPAPSRPDTGPSSIKSEGVRHFRPAIKPRVPKSALSTFGQTWSTLTSWCSDHTIEWVQSSILVHSRTKSDDSRQEKLEMHLDEQDRDDLDSDKDSVRDRSDESEEQNVIRRWTEEDVARGKVFTEKALQRLPVVAQQLGVDCASVELLLMQMFRTFSFCSALPSFSPAYWLTFLVIFLHVASVHNEELRIALCSDRGRVARASVATLASDDEIAALCGALSPIEIDWSWIRTHKLGVSR